VSGNTGLTPRAPELAALSVVVPPAVRKSAVRTLPGPVELTSTVPECSGENRGSQQANRNARRRGSDPHGGDGAGPADNWSIDPLFERGWELAQASPRAARARGVYIKASLELAHTPPAPVHQLR
jgi:hypothetical protein